MLVPHVPGHVLAAQAAMIEAAGLGGIAAPEFYGNPLVTLSHCAANTTRVGNPRGLANAHRRAQGIGAATVRLPLAGGVLRGRQL